MNEAAENVEPEAQEPVKESEVAPETESQAREMGWVPPEEWVGDPPPNGFLNAKDFVKRGETVLPIIQAQNRKLREEVDEAKRIAEEVKATSRQFQQFTQKALERERKEKVAAIARLEQTLSEAVTEGDGDKVVQTQREIHELRSEPEAQPLADPFVEEQIDGWLKRNSWFNESGKMRFWADGMALELNRKGTRPGLATLEEIERLVKQEFPEEFQPKAKPAPTVEGRGRRVAESGGKSWDDLPKDAKAAFNEFKDIMPDYSKQDYLDSYEWDE